MRREGEAVISPPPEVTEKPASTSQGPVGGFGEGPYGPRRPFLGAQHPTAQGPTFLLCPSTDLTAGGGGWAT